MSEERIVNPPRIKTLPERWELPTEIGFYLWYILDFSYLDVGMVQIVEDTDKHRKYLTEKRSDSKGFYIYDVTPKCMHEMFGHRYLTMYHQANDHLPPCDKDGKPHVDGYLPFDMRLIRCLPRHFEEKNDS